MTPFEPLPRYPRTSERDLHRRVLTEAAVLGRLQLYMFETFVELPVVEVL